MQTGFEALQMSLTGKQKLTETSFQQVILELIKPDSSAQLAYSYILCYFTCFLALCFMFQSH